MLRMINEDPTFVSRVLFSNEANFCNNGQVNRHNITGWWRILIGCELFLFNSLVSECGIMGNHIIGPHFFKESLNGEVYTDFLENILQLLENLPLDLCINMWMQHDGAPAHSIRIF